VYDRDIYDATDFAGKHGFGYIVPDLIVPRFFPERFSRSERRHARQVATSKSASISFHGPSDYLSLGALYPEIRQAILDRMKRCIDFAGDVGAERFAFHVEPTAATNIALLDSRDPNFLLRASCRFFQGDFKIKSLWDQGQIPIRGN
jgi:sugar phosphate isomerase/epimerase